MVNIRDRRRVQNAPRPQVNYTDVSGFSQAQLITFEKKSAALIQRRVGAASSGDGSKPKPGAKKAGSSRRRAVLWGMEAVGWVAALAISWSGGLGLGAGALLSWRAGRYLGLWDMAIAASNTMQQTINAFEDAREFMDRVDAMYYEGSLEPYVIIFLVFVTFVGVGIPLLRGAWRQATEYLGVSPTVSPQSTPPASPREYGSSVSEVGEDAELSEVMKDSMKQQVNLAEQMAELRAQPITAVADGSPASARSSSQGTAASAEAEREISSGIERLLSRLDEHENIVRSDAATAGGSTIRTSPDRAVAAPLGLHHAKGGAISVKAITDLVARETVDNRVAMMEHLKRYQELPQWNLAGAKEGIAP